MQNGQVELNINEHIAVITFSHPKSNSLPGKLLSGITHKINEISQNEDVTVVLLKSEGKKAFCAGASFDELLEIKDFETGKQFFMGFALLMNAMRKCPKFIIARVQGKTVGGGVGLASAADYTIATKAASVKLSELALGIGPFVVGPAVKRKIGNTAFGEMSIDYDWHTAEWAERKGLYTKVLETIEEMDEEIEKIIDKLSRGSLEAMQQLKKILWEGTEHWDELLEKRAEISGKLVLSEFTKNYIESFKRK
ncbi:MAG: enoyl-CoA hydratase/isomerase family protein [Ignavibacteria bacterium]